MMNVEEIKKAIIENIDEYVTSKAKAAALLWIRDTGLPTLKELANTTSNKLKEQGDKEVGWNKFRDKYFYPSVISGFLYIVEKLINKMAETDAATI